ncbi:MAG TPA: TRAM domain-containing protein [Acidimicrobiales bacterium]|nr:TRAM domain-containing protein [Acidimicrobiales bacterium]
MPSPDDLLAVTALAVGGEGVAREPSGRVVFVEGALPGERVRVAVTDERRHHARAVVLEVIEPAPTRVTPPCPFVAAGCGGCGWQHVDPEAQRALKGSMVAEALARLGGLPDAEVAPGPVLPATGYRTTLRGVADATGRFALRRHHSHDLVPVPACLVAHPRLAAVAAEGRFPAGREITIRVGARTGDRMVIVDGPAGAVEVPDGVRVVTGDELAGGRRAWLFEVVAGVRLRVSARSFFQAGPDAAEALVAAVGQALGPSETLADLYAGVGLFAATVGRGARVVAVEASASAAADARVNLAGGDAKVVRRDVARWRPRAVEAAVADPPRAGLGRGGLRAVAATRASRVVLVSCDAGALGRDARLLAEAGYAWTGSTLVDAFPHTPHVEVVSRFERRARVSAATGAGMPG